MYINAITRRQLSLSKDYVYVAMYYYASGGASLENMVHIKNFCSSSILRVCL